MCLQPDIAVDDVIVEIKHRRLIEEGVQQREVLGQFLLDFGADRYAVVVVEQMSLIGEVGPIVNEGCTDGIVAEPRNGINAVLHSNEAAQSEVVALVFVGEHLAGQERRVFVVLKQVHLHAAVDLKVGLFPMLVATALVDKRAIEQFVVGVESNQAIVAFDGAIVADVAVIDITRIQRGTETKIVMPVFLCICTYHA